MNGRFSSRFNIKFTSHFTVYFVIGGTASHCMVQIRFMNKSMRVAGICSSVHDWRFPVLNFIMFALVDKLGASANSHVFHCKVTLQATDAGNKSSMHVHGIIMSLYQCIVLCLGYIHFLDIFCYNISYRYKSIDVLQIL